MSRHTATPATKSSVAYSLAVRLSALTCGIAPNSSGKTYKKRFGNVLYDRASFMADYRPEVSPVHETGRPEPETGAKLSTGLCAMLSVYATVGGGRTLSSAHVTLGVKHERWKHTTPFPPKQHNTEHSNLNLANTYSQFVCMLAYS